MKAASNTPQVPSEGRRAAISIVQALQNKGFIAYLAGGCVRDRLLGVEPKDFDVATNAEPKNVRKLFHNTHYVGEAFGVVLVRIGRIRIEVATFRTEWGYQDGRRPQHVSFSDAEHDAQRRDFTINGLFEDPISGKVIDFIGGQADLRAGIIRAIGEPKTRFGEDYLRMLRAVRFSTRFGFTLEHRTTAAIVQHQSKLSEISRERIGQETLSMFSGPRAALAVQLIERLGLDAPLLNEPPTMSRLTTLNNLGGSIQFVVTLAAWALDRHILEKPTRQDRVNSIDELATQLNEYTQQHLPELAKRWRKMLCLSNEHRDAFQNSLVMLPKILAWRSQSISGQKRLLASTPWQDSWPLAKALRFSGMAQLRKTIRRHKQELLKQGVSPPPLVSGDDLIQLGLKPGPAFSRLLNLVYDAQLDRTIASREEALEWLKKHQ